MADPPTSRSPPRLWIRLIDTVTVVWLAVFLLVMLHLDYPVWHFLDTKTVHTLDTILFAMTVLFIADLAVQYQCSHLTLPRFLRARWFDVLMAIPFLRPLRALRIVRVGRLAKVFQVAVRSQRMVALAKKTKRALAAAKRREQDATPTPTDDGA